MKRSSSLIALAACLTLSVSSIAQKTEKTTPDPDKGTPVKVDVKGKSFLNAGIGIGTFGLYGTGGLPITASYEYGFTDKISGGAYVGLISRKYAINTYRYKYYVIGARASYHFSELLKVTEEKLDIYGGASLYYRGYTLNYDYAGSKDKISGGTVGLALHAGARYKLKNNFGVYAELGYGISPLQLGASLQF
jgi:hypothetical protein